MLFYSAGELKYNVCQELNNMKNRPILSNKLYLYLTEFFSGVSVMAVELGASRLLAPYFSSSQIVWTIIIGTIMIAMALGNICGGRWADRDPDPDRLYRRLLIASVWIAAIPFLGRYVILLVSGLLVLSINENFLIVAAFISCAVIFVFPLFLLGTVTPSLVKYTVDSLDDSGEIVGRLNACNTTGSIIGTFLPTFVTIPSVGTSATFIIFSGILFLIALCYFVSSRTGRKGVIVSSVLFVLFSVLGSRASFAFWEQGLTYEGESVYNYLQVKEEKDRVIFSTNVLFGVQSVRMKEGGLTGMYYDYALAALPMSGSPEEPGVNAGQPDTALSVSGISSGEEKTAGPGEPPASGASPDSAEPSGGRDVLVLGSCMGTFETQCETYFPGVRVSGVEIDRKITELAHRYFGLREDADITTYDARAYLAADRKRYDVIFVDAFQDITVPFQVSSKEFFELTFDHLKDNGILVMNMNMRSDGERGLNRALADTVSSVYGDVYTVDVYGSTNRILFAGKDIETGLGDLLRRRTGEMGGRIVSPESDEALLSRFFAYEADAMEKYEAGDMILTDDRSPVELLSMRALDGFISEELSWYREEIRKKGLSAITG